MFQDEFSLSNTATLSATWSLKGRQRVIDCRQVKKERVTGFGSVNPLTGQPIANFAQAGNAGTFKNHLRKVLRAYKGKKKIIIYVDNVRFHHAGILKPFPETHPELEIRCLPAYSPELNPMERVWWYMRKSITHNRYLHSLKERRARFRQLFSSCLRANCLLKNIYVINFYKLYNKNLF